MSREKQIDIIIDLLTEFDEMGFVPTTSVPNPDAYAIKWREQLTNALIEYRKQSEGEWIAKELTSTSKRGRTINYVTYKCSVCGKWNGRHKQKYCPNCGAKMKGGAE